MTGSIAPRFRWAVDLLAPEPGSQVLEIGCGHGIAAGLVAERLDSGCITGIDRSARMIDMAQRRNTAFVSDGRARFHQAAIEDWRSPAIGSFQFALAINIALFVDRDHPGIVATRDLLVPGGTCCIVFQPPSWAKLDSMEAGIAASLVHHRFTMDRVERGDHLEVPIIAVIARTPTRC